METLTTSNTDRSLYFEDYKPGLSIKTHGRTVTEADVVQFACLSGDFNPLHTNVEFAKKSVYGQRIAHGLLTLGMLTGFVDDLGVIKESVIGFTGISWKFSKPVFFGDTIHGELVVARSRGIGAQGLLVLDVKIVNQKGETVGSGEWTLMVKKKNV